MADERPIEFELIETATCVDFEIVSTSVEPTFGDEDFVVKITLQLEDDDAEFVALPLIYVLGLLSFHEGRPRGYSGRFFEDDDQWSAADMLRHLRFERGQLRFFADYVRGRCMKTEVVVDRDGRVMIETINRGEAALVWIDRLRGKTYLAVN